eukprot:CAMPEP_0114496936 /NCGR_PEP_ID=MMETSP0109-20121206/6040_1 /TAXON_ID=29199 /ORGANISM="Chlorarachnion reptans, Strain CCCM449" /LENGTH=371 /DNA_ID=CAMNT_0001674251 /DNA_START=116 /DNA_END=1228 /DNA_ORIENTATION=+
MSSQSKGEGREKSERHSSNMEITDTTASSSNKVDTKSNETVNVTKMARVNETSTSDRSDRPEKKEIYTYEAPWLVYGMNWSVREDKKFRLAIGSFREEYNNKVEIVELDEESGKFECTGSFDHPYPPTKIVWMPDRAGSKPDLLATTGDYLRLWKVKNDGQVDMECLLNNNKNSEFCAPLTSFDWNATDPSIIGTSSIDTTCTIWNVETNQARTQLIAHDKEVYDIAFAPSADVFASSGADGSVRMFDLRSLEHSTIIYESPNLVPLLRLSWNKQDPNYLATFLMDHNHVVIIDIRSPAEPVAELKGHQEPINSIAWVAHSSCHICSGGDDCQALIWDLSPLPKPIVDPILAYNAEAEINTLEWSVLQPEW